MKKHSINLYIPILISILMTSCGSKGVSTSSINAYAQNAGISAKRSANLSPMEFSEEMAMADMESPVPQPEETAYERKLILNGNISVEVTSLEDTRISTEELVKKLGGYISDYSEWRDSLTIVIRVPCNNFDSAMNTVSGIGKLRSKNTSSSDVTDQYYDLDTRLTTKKVMLERLETYLRQAKDIKDMIEIENKINDVTTDIEVMQGQLNRLSSLIEFSTITINANLPFNQTEQGFTLPDAKNEFRDFIWNILNFFVKFFFTVLYIIVYGIPILAFAIIMYWILLGRIGILRKIYSKIKTNNEK